MARSLLGSNLPFPPYIDTNADGLLTANDVLQVINYINAHSAAGRGGEGEPSPDPVAFAARSPDGRSYRYIPYRWFTCRNWMTTKMVGTNCLLRTEQIGLRLPGGGQSTLQSANVPSVPPHLRILPTSKARRSCVEYIVSTKPGACQYHCEPAMSVSHLCW
ncbi:MAG: hypothetical protein R3C56_08620 [Pirellulaceae bacterium]